MAKRWSKTELNHLKKNAAGQSLEELAQRLNTTPGEVRQKLAELGLTAAGHDSGESQELIEQYAKGMSLMQEGQWQKALDIFEAVAADADSRTLLDRTRQKLMICRHQVDTSGDEGDPYLRAVYEKNRGAVDAALELCQGQDTAGDERFAYLMASIQALAGAEDEALEHLSNAIRLEPKNRVHAFHDPDFESLKGHEEFTEILNVS